MRGLLLGIGCLIILYSAQVLAQPEAIRFKEGVHYQVISSPQVVGQSDKVEVVELLWFGCETCFMMQASIQQWRETHKGQVDYQRIPAIYDESNIFFARVFYAAEMLDIVDKINGPLYEAIHQSGRDLSNEAAIARFFEEQGVDKKAFLNAFRSSFVTRKVRQARIISQRFEIAGAPSFVVAGKYRVDASMAVSPRALMAAIDFLITLE